MIAIRIFLGLCSIVLVAGFMWALRSVLFTMGQDFALGTAFGTALTFLVLWAHYKVTGKTVFTAD